jgi:hypothetical protein
MKEFFNSGSGSAVGAFFCFFLIVYHPAQAQDSLKSFRLKPTVSGNISLNSNGIAPVPAFSLGDPALIAGFSLNAKRFSYDPQLGYTLSLKPWIIDNWLRYRFIMKPKFEMRAGFDASMFFSEFASPDDTVWRGQRYFAFELAGTYKFSDKFTLALMYWSDNGIDKGTIKGHFINLVGDWPDLVPSPWLLLAANLQVFYIDYTGQNDGLFLAPRVSAAHRNFPIAIFFQATQQVFTNISPPPGFRWNAGMAYSF